MKHLAAIAFAALFPGAAFAGCTGGCSGGEAPSVSTAWSGDAKAPTRLILVSPSHNYGGPLWMAIEMDIAKGWRWAGPVPKISLRRCCAGRRRPSSTTAASR